MESGNEPGRFDLLGALPDPRSTTVLEASAGTGKTFALAALVTRYLAEGVATLDQMLLITFSRAATQELRERVRRQIAHALACFGDPALVGDNQVVAALLECDAEEHQRRRSNLADALADLQFLGQGHQTLLDAILCWHLSPDEDLRQRLLDAVGAETLETLMSRGHVTLAPAVRAPGNLEMAHLCLGEELPKLRSRAGLAHELREAVESPRALPPERLAWRLAQANAARNEADRSSQEDRTQYETGPNGAKLSKDERHEFDRLIDRISFAKPRRP